MTEVGYLFASLRPTLGQSRVLVRTARRRHSVLSDEGAPIKDTSPVGASWQGS